MSGHSKWANIKHRKAKGDAAKAGIFTKIGRELAVAVKAGGADPNSNNRLKDVIAKAKAANIPSDNITRSIKKASGELGTVNYEEMIYEGYGANGVAIILEALTDNKNRTAGNVRSNFDKMGGAMGTTGCVSYMFARKGVIIIDRQKMTEDDMMLLALDAGANDVVTDEEIFEVYTDPNDFSEVKTKLEAAGLTILSGQIEYIPDNYISLPEDAQGKIRRLIDKFEEDDDIQNVFHNAELTEEDEEE